MRSSSFRENHDGALVVLSSWVVWLDGDGVEIQNRFDSHRNSGSDMGHFSRGYSGTLLSELTL